MALQKVFYVSTNKPDLPSNIVEEVRVSFDEFGVWDSDVLQSSLFDLEEHLYDKTISLRHWIKYHEPEIKHHDIIILHT